MRIFAKKAFEFRVPGQDPVRTRPLDFLDVPDWVASDEMFKWAKADGDIEVIKSAKQQKARENDPLQD